MTLSIVRPHTIEDRAAPVGFLPSLFSVAHDMSAVQRFSRIRMVHPENVLAHTGMVCLFAYAIAMLLRTKAHRELKPLDMGAVMARAVMHDTDETITGDIVRPTKYFSDVLRQELAKLESKGVGNIALALDIPIERDHEMSKAGREGYVVKLADLLAALCTCYIEVCVVGNLAMAQPVRRLGNLLGLARPVEGAKWSKAEREVLDCLIDEAAAMVEAVRALDTRPLPSIHGDL